MDALFVTGGSGCIGRALLRRLLAGGRRVFALTRDPAKLAGAPERLTIVRGSFEQPASYMDALARCRAVVHCATADDQDPRVRAEHDVSGAFALFDAASRAGASRFVHVSTISVYGVPADGTLDESAPYGAGSDPYTAGKIRIERHLLSATDGPEVVVLQPANVYGPGPCYWSAAVLALMRKGRVILVDDGRGTANLVHVDDVARAIELALDAPGVAHERFIVTHPRPGSWGDYLRGLERIVGRAGTWPMTAEEARRYSRGALDATLLGRACRSAGRRLTGRPIVFPLGDDAISRFASRAVFSGHKAAAGLGFAATVDLSSGLRTVERWCRECASANS